MDKNKVLELLEELRENIEELGCLTFEEDETFTRLLDEIELEVQK
jgi:hypothetical protein